MDHARALSRLLVVVPWTAMIWLAWLATRPLGLLSPVAARRTHAVIVGAWARYLLRVMDARLEVRGAAPQPPFFLVANHLSYVDIPVLMALVEGTFLAKSEVARWPVLGFLARTTGTLFIDRARKASLPRVIERVRHLVETQRGVIVFPEGTSTRGDAVLPFKPSLFEVAVRSGSPVRWASIGYATPSGSPPAQLAVCWWGGMTFVGHLYRLLSLPSFRATVTFGPEPIQAADRKSLAAAARRAVESAFTPLVECGV